MATQSGTVELNDTIREDVLSEVVTRAKNVGDYALMAAIARYAVYTKLIPEHISSDRIFLSMIAGVKNAIAAASE